MPLTKGEVRTLRNAGFLPYEISRFARALTPDGKHYQEVNLSTGTWQSAIASRKKLVARLSKAGWSKAEISRSILHYYKLGKGRSPWDFLKLEYRPPRKLSDFQFAVKLKARVRVSRSLGRSYGRPMPMEWRPR